MVYLIGGSSHAGKTLISQKLMERYRIPYLSLDHLKMGLIRGGMTTLTPEDDDEMREFLWPVVQGIIRTAVENGQQLMIEGCYLPEEWRKSFEPEYLDYIRSVFLVMSEDYLRRNFAAVVSEANVIERRLDDRPDLEELITSNRACKAACIAQGVPWLEITDRYDPDGLAAGAAAILEMQ